MADYIELNAGSGGSKAAADDISGILFPRGKITLGGDGTNDGDVSSSNPLPAYLRSELVDDAAFAPGTSRVIVCGATFDDSTTDSVDEGDGGALRMSANRNLYVTIRDSAGNERGLAIDSSGYLTANINGTVTVASHAVTNAGTFAVQVDGAALTSLQLLDDSIVDAGGASPSKGVAVLGSDGINARLIKTDSSGEPQVDVLSVVPGTGATNLGKAEDAAHSSGDVGVMPLSVRQDTAAAMGDTDGDYQPLITDANGRLHVMAAIASSQTIGTVTTLTGGGVAHDSADSGNPVKVGAKATTSLSAATPVSDADRTNLASAVDGALLVRDVCLEDIVTGTPVGITDGSSTSVISAAGSGVKIYITDVTIANSSASNVTVDLRDGVAGSVKWTFPVPANGGVAYRFQTPLPFTANTAVAADPSASATTITVSLAGFKSKI